MADLIEECWMTEASDSRAEKYLRYSHGGMVVVLVLMVVIGCVWVAVALQPDGVIARWLPRLSATVPIAIMLIAGALVATLRGDRWDPNAPEARAIMQDEWRRLNMARAMRGAFVVVIAAQVPLALWLGTLPSSRGVMALAIATMTSGMATLSALFLIFEREGDDAG
jgi:hypothetical protein